MISFLDAWGNSQYEAAQETTRMFPPDGLVLPSGHAQCSRPATCTLEFMMIMSMQSPCLAIVGPAFDLPDRFRSTFLPDRESGLHIECIL